MQRSMHNTRYLARRTGHDSDITKCTLRPFVHINWWSLLLGAAWEGRTEEQRWLAPSTATMDNPDDTEDTPEYLNADAVPDSHFATFE